MADTATLQKAPAPDFGGAGAYRRAFAAGGRVHIDRPLPFLVLNRYPDVAVSLARRVAMVSPSNLVWPATARADEEAGRCLRAVVEHQRDDFPHYLLVSLHDLPRDASLDDDSPRLEPFRFELGATADAPAQAAAMQLQQALAAVRADQRKPVVEPVDRGAIEPGVQALVEAGASHLSLGLPQVYRVPGEEARVYPQVQHDLETAVLDALLQCFAAFVQATTPGDDRHYRTLGRSHFIEAALTVDRELERISRSFDFLLGVSPINTVQAFEQFRAEKGRKPPVFRYRPLTVDPVLAKRALYAIDVRAVEDPVLESLFGEKRRELDLQLTMLQARNTPSFRYASLQQYGPVEPPLLAQAEAVLAQVRDAGGGDDTAIDCHAVKRAADALVARYRRTVPEFQVETCLREDTGPGLMVSGRSLLISTATRMTRGRLDALLQHEVSVHLLTAVNGGHQGLGIFGTGLAGYEGLQEGLGVFAEFMVDGLTAARLRLLAARVLVVHAMLEGAGFVECHRLLEDGHGFSARGAFNIVARVFRSGGLAKDAIYLRGLHQVFDFVASGRALDPFWLGKIAEHHVPVVDELKARGMLRPPVALPEFLSRPSAQRHIERIRGGCGFIELLTGTATC